MEFRVIAVYPNQKDRYDELYRKAHFPKEYASGGMIIMPSQRHNLRRIEAFAAQYAFPHKVGNDLHKRYITDPEKECTNIDEEILNSIFFDGSSRTLSFDGISTEELTEIAKALCESFSLYGVLLKTVPDKNLYLLRSDLPFPEYEPPVPPDPRKQRCAFLIPAADEQLKYILRAVQPRFHILQGISLQFEDGCQIDNVTCVFDCFEDETLFLRAIDGICSIYHKPCYYYQSGDAVPVRRDPLNGRTEPVPDMQIDCEKAYENGHIPLMALGFFYHGHPELHELIYDVRSAENNKTK